MNKNEKTDKVRNSEDRENRTNMLKTKLDALVTAGTLTADEETAVVDSLTFSK
ncbi:hypothetical protein [uncultured Clostridium sp.]|uniref:hypothetical protein n=1 Tax=uncultured Clostridium sp. TaxID=59620 RepID=UPI0028E99D94|nr:hypothetical protein [uncultured Clostridium sp.]